MKTKILIPFALLMSACGSSFNQTDIPDSSGTIQQSDGAPSDAPSATPDAPAIPPDAPIAGKVAPHAPEPRVLPPVLVEDGGPDAGPKCPEQVKYQTISTDSLPPDAKSCPTFNALGICISDTDCRLADTYIASKWCHADGSACVFICTPHNPYTPTCGVPTFP